MAGELPGRCPAASCLCHTVTIPGGQLHRATVATIVLLFALDRRKKTFFLKKNSLENKIYIYYLTV